MGLLYEWDRYFELGACQVLMAGAEVCSLMSFFLANHQADFALNFLSLFLEGAPYILLGTLISGFIDVYMPSSLMDRLLPKNKFLAIFSCGLMGLFLTA